MLSVGASLKDRRIRGGTRGINRGRMKRTPGEGANFPRRFNPRPRFDPEPFAGPLLCRVILLLFTPSLFCIFVPFYALIARLARSCVTGRDRRKLLARKNDRRFTGHSASRYDAP